MRRLRPSGPARGSRRYRRGGGESEPTEYTAQGVCAAGDTRIITRDDEDDDDDDRRDGGTKTIKIVRCRKGRSDAGATDAGACTAFAYTAYGPCQPNGTQTRTIVAASPPGCTGGNPVLQRTCTYTPASDGGTTTPDAGPTACTSFTYSAWGACQPNGTQTRTVLSSSPTGCTGGSPVTTQACTYIDGAALYTQYCAGCHGTSKKGSTATRIQSAIDNNVGGMGSLKFLTPAQVLAISQAP